MEKTTHTTAINTIFLNQLRK